MPLSRRALILLSPDEAIPGVVVDGENWTSHLHSPAGGTWRSGEVQVATNPSKLKLQTLVEWLNGADYTFIAFSGHGSARSETETVLDINDNDTLSAKHLITRAARQTLVLDCCRKLPKRAVTESLTKRMMAMDSYKDPELARRLFDSRLAACDPFRVQLNACAVDQTAGESDSHGGYYTSALIRTAQATPSGSILSVREGHLIAKRIVSERQPSQTPTGEYPRSGLTFPLGIGL